VRIAQNAMHWCAKALGGSLGAWWFSVLTVGPILGSLITEAGAMAICALLLARQFYAYQPRQKLAYATLALLFVNISVGGVLTVFASPAVLILSNCWNWSNLDMITFFGWKAVLGILISNILYWLYFRKEISAIQRQKEIAEIRVSHEERTIVPVWITCIHIFFII